MSISAPRGLKAAPLQTSGKQDGGGNGSGGMFFGQEEQQHPPWQYSPPAIFEHEPEKALDVPFYRPAPAQQPDKKVKTDPLKRLKEYAALKAYEFLQDGSLLPPASPAS